MSDHRGAFCWYELFTPDVEGAKAFYTQVVGWKVETADMGHFQYPMFANAEGTLAGIVNPDAMPDGVGRNIPPHWLGYVATPDVDATTARAKELGATVLSAPMDIPGVGRFSVLADPQGAVFAAFAPNGEAPARTPHAPGSMGWHELYTTDLDAAWAFYSELFGWKKTGAVDMGPQMGEYRTFGRSADHSIGGIMKKPADLEAPPYWQYYTTVTDLGAALTRVRELGGQVLWGPMPVPGGDIVATCRDPQGAVFALYQQVGAQG